MLGTFRRRRLRPLPMSCSRRTFVLRSPVALGVANCVSYKGATDRQRRIGASTLVSGYKTATRNKTKKKTHPSPFDLYSVDSPPASPPKPSASCPAHQRKQSPRLQFTPIPASNGRPLRQSINEAWMVMTTIFNLPPPLLLGSTPPPHLPNLGIPNVCPSNVKTALVQLR